MLIIWTLLYGCHNIRGVVDTVVLVSRRAQLVHSCEWSAFRGSAWLITWLLYVIVFYYSRLSDDWARFAAQATDCRWSDALRVHRVRHDTAPCITLLLLLLLSNHDCRYLVTMSTLLVLPVLKNSGLDWWINFVYITRHVIFQIKPGRYCIFYVIGHIVVFLFYLCMCGLCIYVPFRLLVFVQHFML